MMGSRDLRMGWQFVSISVIAKEISYIATFVQLHIWGILMPACKCFNVLRLLIFHVLIAVYAFDP